MAFAAAATAEARALEVAAEEAPATFEALVADVSAHLRTLQVSIEQRCLHLEHLLERRPDCTSQGSLPQGSGALGAASLGTACQGTPLPPLRQEAPYEFVKPWLEDSTGVKSIRSTGSVMFSDQQDALRLEYIPENSDIAGKIPPLRDRTLTSISDAIKSKSSGMQSRSNSGSAMAAAMSRTMTAMSTKAGADETPKHRLNRRGTDDFFSDTDVGIQKAFSLVNQFKALNPSQVACKWFMPLKDREHRIARIVRSPPFGAFIALVILANSLFIGMHTNYEAVLQIHLFRGNPNEPWGIRMSRGAEVVFCVIFALELSLRIYVDRIEFACGPQWKWNTFDVMLVVSASMELAGDWLTANFSFARTLRMLRVIKVLQVLRILRLFDTLRMMVQSILGSLLSMVWIIVLILLFLYVFGIFFLASVREHVAELVGANLEVDEHMQLVEDFFGDLPKCMLTLFSAVSSGLSWTEYLVPLQVMGWINVVVFLMYFVFIYYGVTNIVTGIFVEKATQIAALDRDLIVMLHLDQMETFTRDIKKFFHEIDQDGNGQLSWPEFEEHIEHKNVKAYFATLGLDVSNAKLVFDLLDRTGDQIVQIDEFIDGCIQLKGNAKSTDITMLTLQCKRMGKMLEIFMDYAEDHFERLNRFFTDAHEGEPLSLTARLVEEYNNSLEAAGDSTDQLGQVKKSDSFHLLSHDVRTPGAARRSSKISESIDLRAIAEGK